MMIILHLHNRNELYLLLIKISRYSKEPLFVTKPLSTEAIEGDTVIISCEVVGDPKPEVMWLRDFLRVRLFISFSFNVV